MTGLFVWTTARHSHLHVSLSLTHSLPVHFTAYFFLSFPSHPLIFSTRSLSPLLSISHVSAVRRAAPEASSEQRQARCERIERLSENIFQSENAASKGEKRKNKRAECIWEHESEREREEIARTRKRLGGESVLKRCEGRAREARKSRETRKGERHGERASSAATVHQHQRRRQQQQCIQCISNAGIGRNHCKCHSSLAHSYLNSFFFLILRALFYSFSLSHTHIHMYS